MISDKLKYQRAKKKDFSELTRLANISKKHWGYSEDLMELWKEDLEINTDYINENEVMNVLSDGQLIGFYALKFDNTNECYEIDHFWLLPEFMGKGFGKQIFHHIMKTLADKGQSKAILEADPNAAGFYEKMNGKIIGQRESKVSRRYLPIFEFIVKS